MQARALRHGYPEWFNSDIPDYVMERLSDMIPEESGDEAFNDALLVTAMSGESYRSFVMDGEYLTFWQTGPTWHHKYSPDPEAGREWNDLRLFGQVAEFTAFALIVCPKAPYNIRYGDKAGLLNYLQSYAPHGKVIEWKDDVLEGSTFTYGDCQQNIVVWDFSPLALMAYVAAVSMTAMMTNPFSQETPPAFIKELSEELEERWDRMTIAQSCAAAFLSCGYERNPYFELQIHRSLKPSDIKRIL